MISCSRKLSCTQNISCASNCVVLIKIKHIQFSLVGVTVYPSSWAALGVGAASVVAGAYFLGRPAATTVSFAPLPGGAAVSLHGRF